MQWKHSIGLVTSSHWHFQRSWCNGEWHDASNIDLYTNIARKQKNRIRNKKKHALWAIESRTIKMLALTKFNHRCGSWHCQTAAQPICQILYCSYIFCFLLQSPVWKTGGIQCALFLYGLHHNKNTELKKAEHCERTAIVKKARGSSPNYEFRV